MERDLSREAAEQLLGGDLMTPPDGTERLAALLAAASAPGRPDEFVGEAAAMAAFRAQPLTVRRWSLRRALTVKVAAVVAVTVAAGGVAVASSAGLLSIPFAPDKIGPAPSGTDGPAGRSPGDEHATNPARVPLAELLALCAEYQKKTADEKQKELKGRRFDKLVREAGSAERVDAYCVQLTATPMPSKSKDGDQGDNQDNGDQGDNQGNGAPGAGTPGDGQGHDGQPVVPPVVPTGSPGAIHGRPVPTG